MPRARALDRLVNAARHPFGKATLILVLCYLVFKYGVAYVPPLFGVRSAPVPASVLLQFMLTALAGVLIWLSEDEDRWRSFKEPIRAVLVEPDKGRIRMALLVLLPLLVGVLAYQQVKPRVVAPVGLRSIHPAPPGQITFRGRTMRIPGLENPLRAGAEGGRLRQAYERGKRVYVQNCVPCHGDLLDGFGHYAHGFNPPPLEFTSSGTIAQLTESFVFWRIAKGGLGLPPEGTPWNSAMPAWEDFLTEDEIWAVIIFLYEQTGWSPRTSEETGAAAE
ncbi:MAG: cytochrome c [Gemmatimonadetes bacterium]|nr:cytochrome c [Gemmatimonadota bacterium]